MSLTSLIASLVLFCILESRLMAYCIGIFIHELITFLFLLSTLMVSNKRNNLLGEPLNPLTGDKSLRLCSNLLDFFHLTTAYFFHNLPSYLIWDGLCLLVSLEGSVANLASFSLMYHFYIILVGFFQGFCLTAKDFLESVREEKTRQRRYALNRIKGDLTPENHGNVPLSLFDELLDLSSFDIFRKICFLCSASLFFLNAMIQASFVEIKIYGSSPLRRSIEMSYMSFSLLCALGLNHDLSKMLFYAAEIEYLGIFSTIMDISIYPLSYIFGIYFGFGLKGIVYGICFNIFGQIWTLNSIKRFKLEKLEVIAQRVDSAVDRPSF